MKKIVIALLITFPLSAQIKGDVNAIMKNAEDLYSQKKFSESLSEWLVALELDPGNEKIQLRIEALYEEKHTKDISLQKSKFYYWEAKAMLESLQKGSIEFKEKDFRKNNLSVQALTDAIKSDAYPMAGYRFSSADKTIPRLNELLTLAFFYDSWLKKKNIDVKNNEFDSLIRWTKFYRNKKIDELSEQELDNIKRLNRFILEYTYPTLCPLAVTGGEKSREKDRSALVDEAKIKTGDAVNNFALAYRIEPSDPDLQRLLDQMKLLQQDMDAELEKKRISEEKIRLYNESITIARGLINEEKYEESIPHWESALKIMPQDNYAKEELRNAQLAVSNRIKFETIRNLLAGGRGKFAIKAYSEALADFRQVVDIDPKNKEALNSIGKIEKILYENELNEKRRIQAEQFYLSGLKNIDNNDFDGALDDFSNVESLIPDYKDVKSRLKNLPALKKIFEDRFLRQKLQEIDREFQNGLLSFSQADYKSALISFERTLILDPNNETSKRFLQTVKDALKQEQEEKIDDSSPYYDLVSSLIVNGKILYENGKYQESEQNWLKILKLFPQNVIATQYLARCQLKTDQAKFNSFADKTFNEAKDLLAKKDAKGALKKYELLKSIAPDYPGIDSLIATTKTEQKKVKIAPDIQPANPQEISQRYERSLALYRKGGAANLENARADVKWIVERDPENNRAIVLLNRVESELRISSNKPVATAKKLTPEQESKVREFYFKGINHYSNNRFQDAISEWRKVLAIDPANEKAKNNIRQCLILLKQK